MKYVTIILNGVERRLMAVRVTYDELRHVSYVRSPSPKITWHDVKNSRAGTLTPFESILLQEGMIIDVA